MYWIIYGIGVVVTLIFLIVCGKRLGVDIYDPPHADYYDDWSCNAHAYTGWSLAWPMFWFVGILVGLWKLLTYLTQLLINSKNEVDNKK